jgi:hypothetical protein
MRKPLALLQHITADENRHKTLLTDTEFCMLPRMASSMFDMAVKRFRENLLIVSSTILYLEFRLRATTRIGQTEWGSNAFYRFTGANRRMDEHCRT